MFITHKGKIMKNKRNQKNIIWKILLIIFSIVLIICLIIIGIQKYQQKKQQEYYEALLENESTQTQATEEMPEPETEEAPDILKSLGIEIPEKDIDFAALQEENSDVYAWIYVPGTNVDYPVLQHPEDDTYYLEHNMDGSKGLEAAQTQAVASVAPTAKVLQMIDVTLPVSFEKAQLTFSVNGVTAGQKIAVLHQKHDGSWEVINPDSVGNGTVTATFTSLSPIAFVAYNASAQTGETTPVLPIIVLICAAGIAVCGAKVKFNN